MTIIPPTVGRVVWYRPSESDAQTMAIFSGDNPQLCAHVVYVHGDRCVNLLVLDHDGNAFRRTSVVLMQEGDAVPGGSYAEWMPYQIGQAKKHEAPQPNGIGWAVKQMQDGKKVRRAGWNGKGMWLSLSGPGPRTIHAEHFWSMNNADYAREQGGTATVLPCITMKTASGEILMGWLASQTDLLATDWEIAA